ncbi:serine protease [Clostridium sp. WILCCON 0269]|uniref:Serine protease n=1 Tax=Candidatus Clostridium eludens TaxID=3381663 RepID=A0ABW8SSD5_9CLOT
MASNIKSVEEAISKLKCGNKEATAFLVSPKLAVTARHAVQEYILNSEPIVLVFTDKQNGKITINAKPKNIELSIEKGLDLVLLELETEATGISCLCLKKELPCSGLEWYSFSYSLNKQSEDMWINGKILGIVDEDNVKSYNINLELQSSLQNFQGISGSPLLHDNYVIGVIVTGSVGNPGSINLGAIDISRALEIFSPQDIEALENVKHDFTHLEIIDIDLNLQFSSTQHLGILFMQPFLEVDESCYPYKLLDDSKDRQMECINNILNLSENNSKNGLNRNIDFVLSPEYSIPGKEGALLIIDKMRNSNIPNQVYIGCIDGLLKEEFIDLLKKSSFETNLKNQMVGWIKNEIAEATWVNTAIIIVKSNGIAQYYLQPKLRPSPLGEDNRMMLEGKWVIIFKTNAKNPIKFFVSICFDWVAITERRESIKEIACAIENEKLEHREDELIQWIGFVPQYNPKPSHKDFLMQTNKFLYEEPWLNIHKKNAMVIMVNSASKDNDSFGFSSSIFPNGYYKYNDKYPMNTYSIIPRLGLSSCYEARFRNNKKAIHAVELVLPLSTMPGSGTERYPFNKAIIHTVDGQSISGDERYPNPPRPVCAYKKIIWDYVESIIGKTDFEANINSCSLEKSERDIGHDIFNEQLNKCYTWDANKTIKIFKYLCRWQAHKDNCDFWKADSECKAFGNFISTLAALRFAGFQILDPKRLHGRLIIGECKYSIMVVDLKNQCGYADLLDDIKYEKKKRLLYEEPDDNILIFATDRTYKRTPRFTDTGGQLGNYLNTEPILSSILAMQFNLGECTSIEDFRRRVTGMLGGQVNE